MNRPKKRDITTTEMSEEHPKIIDTPINRHNYGYNTACNDWEAFLPSEEEILDIMLWKNNEEEAAKAISERLSEKKVK